MSNPRLPYAQVMCGSIKMQKERPQKRANNNLSQVHKLRYGIWLANVMAITNQDGFQE